MIKKWDQFIREFVENSENIINSKMQELKDIIDNVSDGQNLIYEWENKDDHELLINFTTGELSIRYEFDIDEMFVTKVVGDTVDFTQSVKSITDGLVIIEKDIRLVLGINESGQWDSSIKQSDLGDVVNKIAEISKLDIPDNTADIEGLIEEMENALSSFDDVVIEEVIDIVLFSDPEFTNSDRIREKIIQLGDRIMNKYGTEPRQVLNAFEVAFEVVSKNFNL